VIKRKLRRDEIGGDPHNFSGVSVVLIEIEACVDGSPHGVSRLPLSLQSCADGQVTGCRRQLSKDRHHQALSMQVSAHMNQLLERSCRLVDEHGVVRMSPRPRRMGTPRQA